MGSKLYVGNLSYQTTDRELNEMFSEHGEVRSAEIIMDRDTGRSKGFGFVEMTDDAAAKSAIEALNGKSIDGRDLTVNEARPKASRAPSGGGFGSGHRGGGGRR